VKNVLDYELGDQLFSFEKNTSEKKYHATVPLNHHSVLFFPAPFSVTIPCPFFCHGLPSPLSFYPRNFLTKRISGDIPPGGRWRSVRSNIIFMYSNSLNSS
jgi:hypothetical protein